MTKWKPVGFGWGDLYEVCQEGFVRRIGTSRNLGIKSQGYIRVQLSRDGIATNFSVHKIVADAFIGPKPDDKPHIDHINGIRDDNRVENLRYCTQHENNNFTVERGAHAIGVTHGMSALSEEQVMLIRNQRAKRGRFWGATELARKFGVNKSTIRRVASGYVYSNLPAVCPDDRRSLKTGSGE